MSTPRTSGRPVRDSSKKVQNFLEFSTIGYTGSEYTTPVGRRSRIRSGPSYVRVELTRTQSPMESVGEQDKTTPAHTPANTPPGSPAKSTDDNAKNNDITDDVIGAVAADPELQRLAEMREQTRKRKMELVVEIRRQEARTQLEREQREAAQMEQELSRLREQQLQESDKAKQEETARTERERLILDEIGKIKGDNEKYETELKLKRARLTADHKKQMLEMQHKMETDKLIAMQSQNLQEQWEKEIEDCRQKRLERPITTITPAERTATVNSWIQGVSQEAGDVQTVTPVIGPNRGAPHETGVGVLNELGLNPNTVEFITRQASGSLGSRGGSVPRQLPTDNVNKPSNQDPIAFTAAVQQAEDAAA